MFVACPLFVVFLFCSLFLLFVLSLSPLSLSLSLSLFLPSLSMTSASEKSSHRVRAWASLTKIRCKERGSRNLCLDSIRDGEDVAGRGLGTCSAPNSEWSRVMLFLCLWVFPPLL